MASTTHVEQEPVSANPWIRNFWNIGIRCMGKQYVLLQAAKSKIWTWAERRGFNIPIGRKLLQGPENHGLIASSSIWVHTLLIA